MACADHIAGTSRHPPGLSRIRLAVPKDIPDAQKNGCLRNGMGFEPNTLVHLNNSCEDHQTTSTEVADPTTGQTKEKNTLQAADVQAIHERVLISSTAEPLTGHILDSSTVMMIRNLRVLRPGAVCREGKRRCMGSGRPAVRIPAGRGKHDSENRKGTHKSQSSMSRSGSGSGI